MYECCATVRSLQDVEMVIHSEVVPLGGVHSARPFLCYLRNVDDSLIHPHLEKVTADPTFPLPACGPLETWELTLVVPLLCLLQGS
jgi:hypothetical protein